MNLPIQMNACRVCMKTNSEPSIKMNKKILKMFEFVTFLKADPNDNLPNELCQKCLNRLKISYEFRTQAKASDTHLRKFLETVNQQFALLAANDKVTGGEDEYDDYKSEVDLLEDTDMDCEDDGHETTIIQTDSFRDSTPSPAPDVKETKVQMVQMVDIDYQNTEEVISDYPDEDHEYSSPQVVYVQPNREIEQHSECESIVVRPESSDFSPKRKQLKREALSSEHICDKCNKAFSTKTNLMRHLASHDGNRPYVCPTCNKGFTQNGSLKQHIYLHTGEKPFKCNICEKAFTQQKTLTFHMRRHTGEKPFVCPHCNQTFRQRDGLKRHIQVKHNATLDGTFDCNVCGQVLGSQRMLALHKKRHEDDAQYSDTKPDKLVYYSISQDNNSETS